MVWSDFQYQSQSHHPRNRERTVDAVAFDDALHDFYRELIHLRNDQASLRRGTFDVVATNDEQQYLIFRRSLPEASVLVVLNRGDAEVQLDLPPPPSFQSVSPASVQNWKLLIATQPSQAAQPTREMDHKRSLYCLAVESPFMPRNRNCSSAVGWLTAVVWLLGACLPGCHRLADNVTTVTMWHQMMPGERRLLDVQIERFQEENPGIKVLALYKETEELRSGFQAASMSPICPELVYGPSDSTGTYQLMGIIQDMRPWFSVTERDQFVEGALTLLPVLASVDEQGNAGEPGNADEAELELLHVGDRIGNHLALVYNRDLLPKPPVTTDELIDMAKSQTLDTDRDGRVDQYGLVWNYTEPFFSVPFLTGYGAWVFVEGTKSTPALDSPGAIKAYDLIRRLREEYHVVPMNCDYETADALFKSGQAAMIINGDWSWNEYLSNKKIKAAIAPLPIVSETQLPMRPMVASKGYSLSALATGEQAEAAMKFVKFMTSVETQRSFMENFEDAAFPTCFARRSLAP